MTDVNVRITAATEDELWRHGLSLDDALSVIDEGGYRTFRDSKREGRRILIGRDRSGRLLTLVLEAVNKTTSRLITGWPSSPAEQTKYDRPGGSQYAGDSKTDE